MVTKKCPRLTFFGVDCLLGSGFVAFEELADALKNFGKKIKDNKKTPLNH
jgi:hypothetical protein